MFMVSTLANNINMRAGQPLLMIHCRLVAVGTNMMLLRNFTHIIYLKTHIYIYIIYASINYITLIYSLSGSSGGIFATPHSLYEICVALRYLTVHAQRIVSVQILLPLLIQEKLSESWNITHALKS